MNKYVKALEEITLFVYSTDKDKTQKENLLTLLELVEKCLLKEIEEQKQ